MLRIYVLLLFYATGVLVNGQTLRTFGFRLSNGIEIATINLTRNESEIHTQPIPLFSIDVNGNNSSSGEANAQMDGDLVRFMFTNGLAGNLRSLSNGPKGWKGVIVFQNPTTDTLILENMVPFGATDDHVYLTSSGPWSLARSKIFLPGRTPVSVILPDNAWELGYSAFPLDETYSVCAIARRTQKDNALLKRYKTVLPPRGSVTYSIYADMYEGSWQNGLRKMFHERYLYDLDKFDNTLYDRTDLKWIRDKYIITLQFAWDKDFYDADTRKFHFYNFLKEGEKWFGGYDVYGIWPTWPRLGLDERNQWDMYSDLPYGLEKLKELANYARANNTRFFISYNPWDKSTKTTDTYHSMKSLIEEIGADGVVLDTRGNSGERLQLAADSAKSGVIMYSEGMAVPKDMPGIVAGRVHNAIEISPVLNLNKLIKPEFAIFRVVTLNREGIHRDLGVSFFNGYGTEINVFNPDRPSWMEKEYQYLGKTTIILRENSSVFLNNKWTPLVATLKDQIWANRWVTDHKVLYTIFSLDPDGYSGPLIKFEPEAGFHYVSLWNHEEVKPVVRDEKNYLPVRVEEFNRNLLGTNMAGNIECVAGFPRKLSVKLIGDSLHVSAPEKCEILIWKGNPSYQNNPRKYNENTFTVSLTDLFGRGAGKFVVQSFENRELSDERVVILKAGKPYLVSKKQSTKRYKLTPPGMLKIAGGTFIFQVSNPDQFIPYPDFSTPDTIQMSPFYIDKYPVTNADFYSFLEATQYRPKDPANFLKNWKNGMYQQGQDNYPVVYVSLEDARAYARWAGKRLPTELEWQFAAQGTDKRKWPWGKEFHGTKCNNGFGRPTPVNAFSKGQSPFKVEDMVGNVWQLTNDVYENDSYRFVIIRGGSYFNPTASEWYIKGGPQPLNRTQMLLMVSPGFDRSTTVGFRCVSDAD